MYIVKSGLVQVSKLTVDGKELILRICSHDDMVGELSLFSDDQIFIKWKGTFFRRSTSHKKRRIRRSVGFKQ
ncbi:cyclic nucleotide-binding domain-containing protein [Ornithinibacillus californiensis]|uniref:cyclic nucleotide-binding domain-containing protein n=1 Tax=Ornithinibacillus californiensis TaxID=161536 RepID=UPI002E8243B1|nr:cyclic nucleotide-binding domain-containing protein [Ornithinibacillus californiensis]